MKNKIVINYVKLISVKVIMIMTTIC